MQTNHPGLQHKGSEIAIQQKCSTYKYMWFIRRADEEVDSSNECAMVRLVSVSHQRPTKASEDFVCATTENKNFTTRPPRVKMPPRVIAVHKIRHMRRPKIFKKESFVSLRIVEMLTEANKCFQKNSTHVNHLFSQRHLRVALNNWEKDQERHDRNILE